MSLTELVHFDKEGNVVPDSPWRKLYLSLVIILIATLAFGIGRLTGGGEREGIKVEYDPTLSNKTDNTASALRAVLPGQSSIVASRNGTKYHFSYCPGAKQIKEENKIGFNSASEAEASGYTLASNCQPR